MTENYPLSQYAAPVSYNPLYRPRWSRRPRLPRLRYILFFLAVTYVFYCWITSQQLFAHNLPAYTGPHAVGAIDLEASAAKPRIIHDAQFRNNDEPAFKLDTVLFTLYYPAEAEVESNKPPHYWVPPPISLTAEGYAKAARISNFVTNAIFTAALKLLVGGLTIPARVDVPLATKDLTASLGLNSETSAANPITGEFPKIDRFPVLIFSHGMASSRTDYTQYCGELASRGYVVAAIEHRDGSAPGSVVMAKGLPDRNVVHFDLPDVVAAKKSKELDVDEFKRAQLAFRQAEIEETVRVLQDINAGEGKEIYERNPRGEGVELKDWAGKLNTVEMALGGHSYGATGVLQALENGPSTALPFTGAIALDPGKSSGALNMDVRVPLLVVHSNSWSAKRSIFYGRPHFDVVRDLVRGVLERGLEGWFMTSLGTSHPSVTDAPLIEPLLLSWTTGAAIDVFEGLRQYVHVSNDFMWYLGMGSKYRRERRGLLAEKADFPEYDEKSAFGSYKGQGDDWKKYWQIHVAPE